MEPAIDKAEYIRLKYLQGSGSGKKRKKKSGDNQSNIRVVDGDINIGDIPVTDYPELDSVQEEKPVIVNEHDDPMLQKQVYGKNKWRPIAPKDQEKNEGGQSRSSQKGAHVDSVPELVEPRAGLLTAEEMSREHKRLKAKEKKIFESLDEKVSGKYAKPVFRERGTGRKRDIEAEKAEEAAKAADKAKKEAEFNRMSMGLKQSEQQQKAVDDYKLEAAKPFARTMGDEDLDKLLREKEQDGDPMLEYFRKKKAAENAKEDSKAGVKKQQYRGPVPLNRFGIAPGHRWDGVDRSNGFEKRYFDRINEREATREEAYRWATSDM